VCPCGGKNLYGACAQAGLKKQQRLHAKGRVRSTLFKLVGEASHILPDNPDNPDRPDHPDSKVVF